MRNCEYEEVTRPVLIYTLPVVILVGAMIMVYFLCFVPADENTKINGFHAVIGKTIYEQDKSGVSVMLFVGVPISLIFIYLVCRSLIIILRVSKDEISIGSALSKSLAKTGLLGSPGLPNAPLNTIAGGMIIPVNTILGAIEQDFGAVLLELENSGFLGTALVTYENEKITKVAGDNSPFKVYRSLIHDAGVTFFLTDGTKVFLGAKNPKKFEAAVWNVLLAKGIPPTENQMTIQ